MTTKEYARWKGLEVRRPGDVPAATPLGWQIEKHTEHSDRLLNNVMPADWRPEVPRGDAGDALALIALRESMLRDIEMGRGVRVREALQLGATWAEVADALDVEPDKARGLLRKWVDGQHQLYLTDVARGEARPLGVDEVRSVEMLLWCQLGDDESPAMADESDEATADASMPRDPVELEERIAAESSEGWDPDDPYGDVAEYERKAGGWYSD